MPDSAAKPPSSPARAGPEKTTLPTSSPGHPNRTGKGIWTGKSVYPYTHRRRGSQPRVLGDSAGGVTFLLSRAVVYAEQLLTSDIRLSGAGDFIGTRMCRTDSGIIWLAESASPSTEWPAAGLGQGGGGERRSLAVPPGPDLRPGSGHPSVASISFPAYVGDVDHSGEAGVAGDRHVTVVPGRHDLGRVTDAWRGAEGQAVVITASPQTSLTSFLSAIARAMSASVMMPTG
jgi:hypothetical protein